MFIPVVEKFYSAKSPWEIYQALYPSSEVSFFLDSIQYQPPAQTFSYLGASPFLEVILKDDQIELRGKFKKIFPAAHLIKVLRGLFRKYKHPAPNKLPFFAGGAVGYFGYEMAPYFDKVRLRPKSGSRVPKLYLGFYRDLIVYDHKKRVYYLVTHLEAGRNLSRGKRRRQTAPAFEQMKTFFEEDSARIQNRFKLKKFRAGITKSKFEAMVRHAKDYIAAGDIYQANLSQRFSFDFQGSSLALYGALRKINPSPFASFLKIHGIEIVSSSPERLVRKQGEWCETKPIAGTRPRGFSPKSQKKFSRELLSNEKERAEHIMLVDLERNDLGRVCQWPTVQVKRIMEIEKYSHVIHLVSTIAGRIKKNKDAFDLISAMFPGGTITGCPKIRCMEIIDELEPVSRGIYTGSLGYLDFQGNLDLNIVIRTLVLTKNSGYLQVGAGIVHDSEPGREYEETLQKGEALVEALVKASE